MRVKDRVMQKHSKTAGQGGLLGLVPSPGLWRRRLLALLAAALLLAAAAAAAALSLPVRHHLLHEVDCGARGGSGRDAVGSGEGSRLQMRMHTPQGGHAAGRLPRWSAPLPCTHAPSSVSMCCACM